MKVYCDITEEEGCIGVILKPGVEVVFTGAEVHTEPAKLRSHPMAIRLAEECDFRFWFRDERPEPPIYTVPKTEIAAFDSRGGYFVTLDRTELDWSTPLYYIDSMLVCHRILPTGTTLADMGLSWRETMIPCDDVEAFPNRAAAEARFRILTLRQLMEEAEEL